MAWQPAVVASNGTSYEWYQQDVANSCGCASILMMVYMMQNKKLDEATVRQWMNEVEVHQNADSNGVRSFKDMGGNIFDYTGVLADKVKIKSHTVKNDGPVRKWVTTAKSNKPLLAHVFWVGGGGHTILVAGHTATHTIFLDPGIGLVEIPDGSLNGYTTDYGAGAMNGSILALVQPA
jgi:hypothetical protein